MYKCLTVALLASTEDLGSAKILSSNIFDPLVVLYLRCRVEGRMQGASIFQGPGGTPFVNPGRPEDPPEIRGTLTGTDYSLESFGTSWNLARRPNSNL